MAEAGSRNKLGTLGLGWRLAGAAALCLGLSAPAFAHSGGSSGGSGGASSGASHASPAGGGSASGGSSSGGNGMGNGGKPDCPPGEAKVGDACQKLHSGLLPDRDLYARSRALALAGYYQHALPLLEAVQRTDDPMVYTMRGYAERKLGRFDTAVKLYDTALAIDPNNPNTHEYLGEGYVTTGRLDLARVELVKVERGCGGTGCEQYEDLARAIETGIVE